MKRLTLLAVSVMLLVTSAFPAEQGLRFVSIVFHNVVDKREDMDPDGITADRLIALFEFLRGNGWTAITLDDLDQAARHSRSLPARAILITVDDGYRSAYSRIFPLLLAYRMPALVALVGSWMSLTGDPRYMTWDQAREMQRSGLVEFASHSYDLHHGAVGNPQGNELPPAAFRRYDPVLGYESEDQFRMHIRQDLNKSIDLMKRELGRTPRAIVWPYGRYTAATNDVAREEGFTFGLTLDSEPADASKRMAIPRYLFTQDSDFGRVISDLRSINVLSPAQRLVRLDPSALWSANANETDARLGKVIERVRKLGATSVFIDAAVPGANDTLSAAWFPNRYLPVRADVFSRFAWQLRTRAGVNVYGRLLVKGALNTLQDQERVLALFRDFGAAAPVDGLLLEDVPQLAAMKAEGGEKSGAPWNVRERRDAVNVNGLSSIDALALRCYRILEAARPRLMLALLTTEQTLPGPSSIADMTLVATSEKPKEAARVLNHFKKLGFQEELFPRRFGIWINGPEPPSSSNLIAITRMFQRNGISVIGWDDDMIHDNPPAALVAGSVSASTFPVRF